ncbi:hypothetical protein J7E50_23470 [Pedobacter sp. ISL-68]|uniref:hypothetical protein n=1 Tax=unclassified Pedobacter TaxID=2628915 RepID=UPI001BE74F20|nr:MULTISPECIES: hypothetical protein [unclassified Pedobacter]MBT2564380.1 hypothetical protein [Pedobacter sp. ISL-64]MBT2593200.1 hypothetical protein [Pedobacter sp. ISL-68]
MTQQNLLALLGLPVTDPNIISFFAQRNLVLPQSVPIMKPNSTTPLGIKNSGGLNDKEWGFSCHFKSEVLNEDFPVLKEGKKYLLYLTQIVFDGKLYQKRQRKEPDSFWNVSPPPDSSLESIENHFGKFDQSKKYPSIYFPFNKHVDIIVSLISTENRLSGYFAAVKETYELYHATEFDRKWNYEVNLILMVIKWLNDHHYLINHVQPLTNNVDSVLTFVQTALNSHLWESQLIQNEQLRKFMLSSFDSKYGLKNKFYALLRQLEHYESLEWAEQKQWVATISFNDETYAAFYTAMNQSFEQYKILKLNKQ